MTHSPQTLPHDRILAVNPCSRGLGFAVLTNGRELIDWGLKQARGTEANNHCLRAFHKLRKRHRPKLILVEDTAALGCVRSDRIVELLSQIQNSAECRVGRVGRLNLLHRFIRNAKSTSKQSIAEIVSQHYPELAPHLPAPRRNWQSEDQRLAFFWAVSMALYHLQTSTPSFTN